MGSRRDRVAVLFVAFVAAVSAVAQVPASAATAPKPDPNATLVWATSGSVIFPLDPQKYTGSGAGFGVYTASYDRLVQLTPDSRELAPMLAESWKWDTTGTALTFNLRKDVKFQDGAPFTADIAVQNVKRAAEPGSNGQLLLANMIGVAAVDPSTLRLTFATVDPAVIYAFTQHSGMMVSPTGLANPASMKSQAMGSGAYRVVGIDADLTYHLERFNGYWDKTHVYPAKIEYKQILDENTRLNALRTGVIDGTSLSQVGYEAAKADTSLQIAEYEVIPPWLIYMNNKVPPFDKLEVRKAVSLAIDREALAQSQGGRCTPLGQMFPKGVDGYVPSLKPKTDLAAARKLMASVGVSNTNVKMIYSTSEPYVTFAKILQAQLKEIGLNADLTTLPGLQVRPTYRQGGYGLMVAPIVTNTPDPSGFVDTAFVGPDNPGNIDPKLVDMVASARKLPLGSSERASAFEAINRFLVTNMVAAPMCSNFNMWVGNRKVVGLDKMPQSALSAGNDFHYVQVRKSR